nr:MAG TPA: hypothetical protein [Caudoviricetes sp.]
MLVKSIGVNSLDIFRVLRVLWLSSTMRNYGLPGRG